MDEDDGTEIPYFTNGKSSFYIAYGLVMRPIYFNNNEPKVIDVEVVEHQEVEHQEADEEVPNIHQHPIIKQFESIFHKAFFGGADREGRM